MKIVRYVEGQHSQGAPSLRKEPAVIETPTGFRKDKDVDLMSRLEHGIDYNQRAKMLRAQWSSDEPFSREQVADHTMLEKPSLPFNGTCNKLENRDIPPWLTENGALPTPSPSSRLWSRSHHLLSSLAPPTASARQEAHPHPPRPSVQHRCRHLASLSQQRLSQQ